MRKRKPLTIEEHQEMGRELYEIRDRVQALTTKMSGRWTARECNAAIKVERAIDRLRFRMEDLLCRDGHFHVLDHNATRVYFRRDRAAGTEGTGEKAKERMRSEA